MVTGFGFGDLGAGFTWTHIIALAYIILVCLAFSELATMYPKASSLELYTTKALGSLGGITVGLWYGFKDIFGFPAEATLVGLILEYFFPAMPWWAWAILVLTIFMILNMLGIVVAGVAQLILLVIMVGSYIVMGLVGFLIGSPNYAYLGETLMSPPGSLIYGSPAGLPSILVLTLMGVWLFVGMEVAAPLAEEVKRPERTIPLAMLTSMIALFAFREFMGLSWVASVPRDILLSEFPPPHIAAAEYLLGLLGALWFAIISFMATGTTINAVLAGATRVLYGMSREGYLPKVFGWLHPKYKTPWGSLLILYILMVIIILLAAAALGVEAPFSLALCCAFVFMAFYALMFIDVLLLRIRRPEEVRPFTMGGPRKFPVLSLIGLIATFVILYYSVVPPLGDVKILYAGGAYCVACFLAALAIYYLKIKKGS